MFFHGARTASECFIFIYKTFFSVFLRVLTCTGYGKSCISLAPRSYHRIDAPSARIWKWGSASKWRDAGGWS